MLTQELVKELFDYRDGVLYWKVPKAYKIKVGDKAGGINAQNYMKVKINGRTYSVHRIIFLYHHGYLPKMIDHADRNPLNNCIDNLREATSSQNQQNTTRRKTNKYKGVFHEKRRPNLWRARIGVNNEDLCLGYFSSEIEAARAYDKAALKHFGEFAKLNFEGTINEK